MTRDEIITQVRQIGLPPRSYIVFGSAPLAVGGIREAQDVDLLISPELYAQLKSEGWQVVDKGPQDTPVANGAFEAHQNWNFSTYNPTLEQLLARAEIIEGVPFAPLEDVYRWKAASGRPKDLVDLQLIEAYRKAG